MHVLSPCFGEGTNIIKIDFNIVRTLEYLSNCMKDSFKLVRKGLYLYLPKDVIINQRSWDSLSSAKI